MKKIIAVLLSMILFAVMVPVQVFADDNNSNPVESANNTAISSLENSIEERPAVKAEISGAGIAVTWNKIDGAIEYVLYRSYNAKSDPSTLKKFATTTETSYQDNSIKSGKTAYYYVQAKTEEGYTDYSAQAAARIIRVYVETGHGIDSNGKWDPGCKWKGYQEAKLMIPIAKSMTNYLRKNGIYVYTDAFSGNNKNLFKTLSFLDKHSVSAFVNIHCDYKKAKAGTLPLYRTAEQKKLAKALNKGVHSTVKIKNRGLKKRTDLKTLKSKKVHCPACLFETGCISKDNKILRTKYDAYGKGLAKGLCNYLGVAFEE